MKIPFKDFEGGVIQRVGLGSVDIVRAEKLSRQCGVHVVTKEQTVFPAAGLGLSAELQAAATQKMTKAANIFI